MRQATASGMHIALISVHGLIRGNDLELGRDADTGGQTKYVVELARALARRPEVRQVDLITRRIADERVSDAYAVPIEPIADNARIVRVQAGGERYRRKELLWPSLDAFVRGMLAYYRDQDTLPDLVHGHYADAGYVAMAFAELTGRPLVFTGHSLGRNKRRALQDAGMDDATIERQYRIGHRIGVEEEVLRRADLVIASTRHEVARGYEAYDAAADASFEVIPPGIDVERFYPYFYDLDDAFDPGDAVVRARVRMRQEIARFLTDPDKPLVLAISRPDRRKNIDGLVTAYGEDKELQHIANLAVFAGVRKDIEAMDDNEREVLTRMLLLMDRYDLYGRMALPKKHEPDSDIPVLYRLAAGLGGVFVNPALVENFGITLIEASSSGLPVVSTAHGGPADILELCASGELIDARDTSAIQAALRRILVDRERWERYSENGIRGVRRHFSWDAHAEHYLEAVTALQDQPDGNRMRARAVQALRSGRRVLVSDIDHTLVDDAGRPSGGVEALAKALGAGDIALVVATGRSLSRTRNVVRALEAAGLPAPVAMVCSVGSEIYYGEAEVADRGWAHHLERGGWDRRAVVRALDPIPFLTLQEDDAQGPYKVSYYLEPSAGDVDDPAARAGDALAAAGLEATVIASRDRFVDVLPTRASKGRAVRWLERVFGLRQEDIAVAGDSGNDREMLVGRHAGIVVGNHAPELADLAGRAGITFVRGSMADGVVEGLRALGWLED